jgi:hypothetical protein
MTAFFLIIIFSKAKGRPTPTFVPGAHKNTQQIFWLIRLGHIQNPKEITKFIFLFPG